MKAYPITQYGLPEHFTEIDLPDPEPGPGQVLIRVAASSVNPVDTKIRAGGRAMCPDLPAVLHMDVSGTVAGVGAGVDTFHEGDKVYGCAGGLKTVAGEVLPGALAEYMLADARLLAPAPTTLDLAEAAALPLVTITAWEALIDRAQVAPDQPVLVHGGAGGVGHVAVQLAVWAGARVYTTVSSEEKARIARDLGALVAINYRETPVADYVAEHTGGAGFPVVMDTVGGENLQRSMEAAAVNGTVCTILASGEHDLTLAHARGLNLHAIFMLIPMLYEREREAHGRILEVAADLVERGHLRPLIDPQRFGFSEAGAAHRKLESGQALGKILLLA